MKMILVIENKIKLDPDFRAILNRDFNMDYIDELTGLKFFPEFKAKLPELVRRADSIMFESTLSDMGQAEELIGLFIDNVVEGKRKSIVCKTIHIGNLIQWVNGQENDKPMEPWKLCMYRELRHRLQELFSLYDVYDMDPHGRLTQITYDASSDEFKEVSA
jgi:hypothetical protein